MSKSAFVKTRIEPELKDQVEKVLDDMGITSSQVVTMLYKQIQRTHELPLEFFMLDKETVQAIPITPQDAKLEVLIV